MVRRRNNQMEVVFSDLHIPFQDHKLCETALEFVRYYRPGAIHLLGDVVDFYACSKFAKDPLRKETLQDELDEAREFLFDLRKAVGKDCEIIYSQGNHERRLERYLATNARELASLRCLRMEELLDFERNRIKYRQQIEPYKRGHLWLLHGEVVRKHAGVTARAHYEKIGGSVLVGHSHRLGKFYRTDGDQISYKGVENGCMCSLEPEYMTFPDWQQGWSIIWRYNRNYVTVDTIEYIHGILGYHGKEFGTYRKPNNKRFIVGD